MKSGKRSFPYSYSLIRMQLKATPSHFSDANRRRLAAYRFSPDFSIVPRKSSNTVHYKDTSNFFSDNFAPPAPNKAFFSVFRSTFGRETASHSKGCRVCVCNRPIFLIREKLRGRGLAFTKERGKNVRCA